MRKVGDNRGAQVPLEPSHRTRNAIVLQQDGKLKSSRKHWFHSVLVASCILKIWPRNFQLHPLTGLCSRFGEAPRAWRLWRGSAGRRETSADKHV